MSPAHGGNTLAELSSGILCDPVTLPKGKRFRLDGDIALGNMLTWGGACQCQYCGVPKGIRTPVSGVKSRGPGPLDDGDEASPTYRPTALV